MLYDQSSLEDSSNQDPIGELPPAVEFPETADIETSSEDYATRFSGQVGEWFLKVQEQATLKMITDHPGATILDVGGGHGQVTDALVRKNFRVTVLGSSLECSQRILPYIKDSRISFKVGNILDLPFPDCSFEVVISYRLLPHVHEWRAYLGELARVAEKAVIFDYPEVRSVNYVTPYFFRFKKGLEGNTRTYSCFRENELKVVFHENKFELSDRYAQFFLPMVFHRKLGSPKLSQTLEKFFRFAGFTKRFGSPVIVKMVRMGGLENEHAVFGTTAIL